MAEKPKMEEPIVGSPVAEPTLESKRADLTKAIADAKVNIGTLEANVKGAESNANKAWESRDREAFNKAENERLGAVSKLSDGQRTIKRLEDALDDLGKATKRASVNPLVNHLEKAVKDLCNVTYKDLIGASDGLESITLNIGLRSMQDGAMKVNATGATVSHASHGPWFTRPAGGGKAKGTGEPRKGKNTYTIGGQVLSSREVLALPEAVGILEGKNHSLDEALDPGHPEYKSWKVTVFADVICEAMGGVKNA